MIERTLASVLEQTLSDHEIIVSDDCSTDNSWAILQDVARGDSRIRLVRTPHNMGMAGNANFAVDHSTRPYIALLHHDDIYRSDLLQKWHAIMARHSDVGFVFNQYALEGSDHIWSEPIDADHVDGRFFLNRVLLAQWGCPVRGTAMIRNSAWQELGGMRPRFNLLADIDLWMRLAMNGSVGYVAEPVIILRQDRPEDYPAEYKEAQWSWKRQRYLYEIHIENMRTVCRSEGVGGRFRWLLFVLRLNLETAKWLSYAVVRRKPEMLRSSGEGATECDLWPLRLYRAILRRGSRFFAREGAP